MTSTVAISGADASIESPASAVSWGPIIAGAMAAATLTLVLMLVGSGFGLTMVSPWAHESAGITTFAVSAAIWLVIVQWLSSALGGYLTGRLRARWVGIHNDETLFRDTAHGFMSWALATLLVAFVLGSAISATVGAGARAVSGAAAASAKAVAGAADQTDGLAGGSNATLYFVDGLFRPSATTPTTVMPSDDGAAAAQASRILIASAARGEVLPDDRLYLAQLVESRTGLSRPEAEKRVNDVLAQIDAAKTKAQEAADTARKASATFAIVGALSMIIGAFIAAVSAALGGSLRDEDEARYLATVR